MKHRHEQYKRMQSRWQMCRDAAAGEYEVHEKTTEYLPKLSQEKDDDYRKRLKRTPFFNATWRTIIMLRGMLFRKEPLIVVPDAMADELLNIDNTGMSLSSFMQDLSLEALTVGRSGVLVDHTQVPQGITSADSEMIGARPFMSMYTTESIIDWEYTNINGRKLLSMVRLNEDTENYNDIEIEEDQEIHRVLKLTDSGYIQQIFIIGDKTEVKFGDDIVPRMNGSSIDFIPFQPIGIDTLKIDVDAPPLIDLVTMNFHHYRQSSSYEQGCFVSGLPTLFIYGNNDNDKKIYVGGAMANSFPDPSARAEFVEVKSNFQALRENLQEKKDEMAILGARMLESRRAGVESGDAWERKQVGEESILSDIATTISAGMTKSLKWYAEWGGYDPTDISINLNKEFLPFSMTSQQITALVAAHNHGTLSYNALYHNFNRAGLYPTGSTIEDEQGNISEGNTL